MTTPTTEKTTAEDFKDEWVRARRAGETLESIGARSGYSAERVRQVVAESRDGRTGAHGKQRDQRVREMREWLEENGPVTRQAVLGHFKINGRQLAYLVKDTPDFPMHLIMLSARPTDAVFSDEDVHAAMRRVWAEVQRERPRVTGLSHALYDKYRSMDEPSPARIIGRENTWEAACDRAGVPAGSTYRTKQSYGSVWAAQDLWDALIAYLAQSEEDGIRPSYARYDRWQKSQQGRPSGTTVRLKMRTLGFPNWPGIVEEAVRRRSASNQGMPEDAAAV